MRYSYRDVVLVAFGTVLYIPVNTIVNEYFSLDVTTAWTVLAILVAFAYFMSSGSGGAKK